MMKNENDHGMNAATLQQLASLPGESVNSKRAKESKIIKCRAIVFERQMTDIFEIIF
jgi:hypothetical protein